VRFCIDTAERWAKGRKTTDKLQRALALAAYLDGAADAADAYASAAYASAVATAFSAAAPSAAAAAYASAAYAADGCTATESRLRVQAQCADIVREDYPFALVERMVLGGKLEA